MLDDKLKRKKQHKKTIYNHKVTRDEIEKVIIEVGLRYITIITKTGEEKHLSLKLNLKTSIQEATTEDIYQTKQCRNLRLLNFYTKNGVFFKNIKAPLNIRMKQSRIYDIFYDYKPLKFIVLIREELFGE